MQLHVNSGYSKGAVEGLDRLDATRVLQIHGRQDVPCEIDLLSCAAILCWIEASLWSYISMSCSENWGEVLNKSVIFWRSQRAEVRFPERICFRVGRANVNL
jgi:hypothetical protein